MNNQITNSYAKNNSINESQRPNLSNGLWTSKEIRNITDLNESEKNLLTVISNYSKNGVCFASNDHLIKLFNKNERTIQRWLKKLKQRGYVVEVGFDGRKRLLKSTI